MLDYEEYGNSFRQPRALRPTGAPANNTFSQYDGGTTQPEGRPRTAQPADGQPADTSGTSIEGGYTAPQQPQTFSQMQQQGYARPPAPTAAPTGMTTLPGMSPTYAGSAPTGSPTYDPSQSPYTGGLEGQLYNAYNNYSSQAPVSRYTGQFQAPTSSVNPQIEQAIMSALGNPSRYDANVVKDSFGYLGGAIDDQYNKSDEALRSSLAERGLGAAGDGTYGTSSMINQNLARRSAKQNLASELLREQANTYGSDRASAIAQAMGFGQNQFGNSLDAFNANMGANQQNWNQDFTGRQFDAGQRQQALNNYLGYGQQSFNNQMATSQYQNQQQQQNYDMLLKLLGIG